MQNQEGLKVDAVLKIIGGTVFQIALQPIDEIHTKRKKIDEASQTSSRLLS
jgi:hypothetical protein